MSDYQQFITDDVLTPVTSDCDFGNDYVLEPDKLAEIKQLNEYIVRILIKAVDTLESYMFGGWSTNFPFVTKQIEEWIRWRTHMQKTELLAEASYISVCEYFKKIMDNVLELLDTITQQLNEDYLSPHLFNETLNSILETQISRLLYDIQELPILEAPLMNVLVEQIQQLLIRIVEDFFNYQISISFKSNQLMTQLDSLLQKYPTIANRDNYRYMQKEVSNQIIEYANEQLPWYYLDRTIAKQSIRNFYALIESQVDQYKPIETVPIEQILHRAGSSKILRSSADINDATSSQCRAISNYKRLLQLSAQQAARRSDNVMLRILLLYQVKQKKVNAPKKPIKYGAQVNMVAGKALGAGLGQFLVDCFDEDVSWEDKFKHAGMTTLTVGLFGILAARLPVVGLIIQQAILAYAIKCILDNKVINNFETIKNIVHLVNQLIIGIGLTIAGMIYWHGFWGGFAGGFAGGVGMTLYSKVIVPMSMGSLVEMMTQSSKLIRSDGSVKFCDYIVLKMRFSENYFHKHKPKELNEDEWITLLMYALASEIKNMSRANYLYQLDKLKKQNKCVLKLIQNEVSVQSKLSLWNECYDFLKSRSISMMKHAQILAQFVDFMLLNFKIS